MTRTSNLLLVAALLAALATPSVGVADLVAVVCEPRLAPAFNEWVAYREAQGHRVRFLTADQPTSRTADLRADARAGERVVLLLVGDGDTSGPPPEWVPVNVVSRYGPERLVPSDAPHAGRAQADAIGRLPFNDQESLRAYLRRVVQRERSPATYGDARLQVTAGVGGFSPWIDSAIESAASNLLRDLAPIEWELSLTRCSPTDGISPKPPLARGGVWVWMGHGLRDQLPGVRDDQLVAATGGADIALLLACYAGDFSAPGRCVAERLIGDPHGPLAVVASTGVSMPYGNARLGAGMLRTLRSGVGADSIGALFRTARGRLTADGDQRVAGLDHLATLLGHGTSLSLEREDHALLYQLVGDPLLTVDRYEGIHQTVQVEHGPNGALQVSFTPPMSGRARVEWLPHTPAGPTEPRQWSLGLVEPGTLRRFSLPRDPSWQSGSRVLRLGIESPEGLKLAAVAVRRERSKASRLADAGALESGSGPLVR